MRLTITILTLILFSAFGQAQGIGALKNAFGGGDDSSGGDTLAMQAALILGMSKSTKFLLESSVMINEAIGSTDNAKELKNLASQKPSETDKNLQRKFELITETRERLAKFSADGKTLDEAGKKRFEQALGPYARGTVLMLAVVATSIEFVQAATKEITNIKNPMQIMKIKKQFEIGIKSGKQVPAFFKAMDESTKMVWGFAKANDIPTKNFTAQLKEGGASIPAG